MISLALFIMAATCTAAAYWIGGASGYSVGHSEGYSRGYDTGKSDGLDEGWKHWPERDSRGRYKAKETA